MIQPAFFQENSCTFLTLCFGVMIFWQGEKSCVVKMKNGSYFPNHNTLF